MLPLALALSVLGATPAVSTPLDESLALVKQIREKGCPASVMGAAWPWAPLGCDAFTTFAIASTGTNHRPAALAAMDELLAHALSLETQKPFATTGSVTLGEQPIAKSVLYRGLVLLMIVARETAEPKGARSKLADAIAASLVQDLAASPSGWLPTYGADQIRPCDHAPAAAALVLHGRLRKSAKSGEAGTKLIAALEALRAGKDGFPTKLKPTGEVLEATPRGVAMAWTAGFLLHADEAAARKFAEDFTARFCDRVGPLAACREWPRGVDSKGDDSAGHGIAASALGMAATRALARPDWHVALLRAAEFAGIGEIRKSTDSHAFEKALDLWARTAEKWATKP